MTAASSLKPKAKFSSRNVSSVYRAPALRDSDYNGGSSGFRTGGVNGLNRLVVLRGPVRDANTAAAPTPINTPSLKKEHMGQDIHVNLVPAGKSGWGHHHQDETTEAASPQKQQADDKQDESLHHQHHEHESAWDDGAPLALVGRPRQPSSSVTSAVSTASSASGRWGDDAVEEDFAQVELQRDLARKREFPDLHEQQAQSALYHQGSRHDYHAASLQSAGDPDARHVHSPQYDRRPSSSHGAYDYNHGFERGYGGNDEHAHPGLHVSLQDARYISPVRNGPQYRYERPHSDMHHDLRRHSSHDEERYEGERVERFGGMQRFHRSSEEYRSGVDNQSEHDNHPKLESAWKAPLHLAPNTPVSSNVWRMSETEANAASRAESMSSRASPSSNCVVENSSVGEVASGGAYVNGVRILRRTGPRMLFDHKSGTMVEVEDTKTSRRSQSSVPTQSSDIIKAKPKVVEQRPAVTENARKQQLHPKNDTGEDGGNADGSLSTVSPVHSAAAEAEVPATTVAVSSQAKVSNGATVAQEGESSATSSTASSRAKTSKGKTKLKESMTKRVPMGGKMKRVVVAYRPVGMSRETEPTQSPDELLQPQNTNGTMERHGMTPSPRASSRRDARAKTKTDGETNRPRSTKESENRNRLERFKKIDDSNDSIKMQQLALRESDQRSRRLASSKLSKVGARPKAGIPVRALEASVPVDEHAVEEDVSDDGGGAFTTVKSRRIVMLERKKQREQLAAALSGFHERGDVKRPNGRVTLPASIARFGKKGLLVEFKQKSKPPTPPKPVPLPVLEKSFIDVIRPPAVAQEMKSTSLQEERPPVEHRQVDKPVRQQALTTCEESRAKNEARGVQEETAGRVKDKKPFTRRQQGKARVIDQESMCSHVENTEETSTRRNKSSRSLASEKRPRQASTVKEKKVYVPKGTPCAQAETPATPAVDKAQNPPIPAAVVIEKAPITAVSPKVEDQVQQVKVQHSPSDRRRSSRKGDNEKCSAVAKDTASLHSTQKSSETSLPTSTVAAPVGRPVSERHVASVEPASIKPAHTTRKVWKKAKSVSVPDAPQVDSRHEVSNVAKMHQSSAHSVKPEKAPTPIPEQPPKMHRGVSGQKATISKSATSSKIYKQVYVVKATASPTSTA